MAKLYSGDDQIYTPDEMQRVQQARTAARKGETRFAALRKIASTRGGEIADPFFAPGINDDPGFLNIAKNVGLGALDILQRGNFVAAGIVDELLIKKAGPIAALGRVGKELFSGVGSIKGEKDTFRDILDSMNAFDETRLGDAVDAADLPIIGNFNLRGTVGLAMDIFLDPLTYLTGGGSALAKVAPKFTRAVAGRITPITDAATQAFTKAGRKARGEAFDAEMALLQQGKSANQVLLREEAKRQAIIEVQDNLHRELTEVGIKAGRAGELSEGIAQGAVATSQEAVASLNTLLNNIHHSILPDVKKAAGLSDAVARGNIGRAIMGQVEDASSRMLRTGLDEAGELTLLAADIANKRAQDVVLEMAKLGKGGLTRDLTPLRWFRIGIGPKGKTLTQAVVESGMSAKMVGFIRRVAPDAFLRAASRSTAAMGRAMDVAGNALNTEWTARKLQGYHILRRMHLDAIGGAITKNRIRLRDGAVAKWYDSVLQATKKDPDERLRIMKEFAHAVDGGNIAVLKGDMGLAAREFRLEMQKTVAIDIRKGLMKAKNVRINYFPHFIDAPEEMLSKILAARPGRTAFQQATIGRHAEARAFDTFAELEAAARLAGVEDAIKINYDPMVALLNRTETTIEGSLFDDFYRAVAKEFGRSPESLTDASAMFNTAMPRVIDGSPAMEAATKAAVKGVSIKDLDALIAQHGDLAGGEYLRQRILKMPHPKAVENFMLKYERHIDLLPRRPEWNVIAPDGGRYVDMAMSFKGLRPVRIPESAAKHINNMSIALARSPEVGTLLRLYDGFTNRLKVWLTSVFPAFHFRNKYSNVAQAFLDIGIGALDPRVSIRSARLSYWMLDTKGQVLNKLKPEMLNDVHWTQKAWADPSGRTVSMREARNELINNNIVRSREAIFETTGIRPKAGVSPKSGDTALKRVLKPGRELTDLGTQVGSFIENWDRIGLYVTHRSRGLSQREATDRVNKIFFDYDDLTEIERQYMKRLIPFWVWTKKNVALQADAFRNMPGRQANLAKPFNTEDPDVTANMLEYQQAGMRLQMDRNGKDVKMLSGIDLPIMSIDRLLPIGKLVRGQFGGAIRQVAASMNPLIRTPAELAAGMSFFDERPLDRKSSAVIGRFLDPDNASGKVIPDGLRKWLGYARTDGPYGRWYSFDGNKWAIIFNSWGISRIMTSSDPWFRQAAQEPDIAAMLLKTATALRFRTVNMDEARARKVQERINILEEELIKQGLLKRADTTFEIGQNRPGSLYETSR